MTDDVARQPVGESAQTSQSGEPPRRSRRRGKRSKNKGAEAQAESGQTAPAPGRQPERAPQSSGQSRGSRRSPSLKSGFLPFSDGLDRFVCLECLRFLPEEFPVQHRRGTATIPLREVDRRDGELLFCNGLHTGPCLWPDGARVEADAPEPVTVSEPPSDPEPGEPEDLEEATQAAEPAVEEPQSDAAPTPPNAPMVKRLIGPHPAGYDAS